MLLLSPLQEVPRNQNKGLVGLDEMSDHLQRESTMQATLEIDLESKPSDTQLTQFASANFDQFVYCVIDMRLICRKSVTIELKVKRCVALFIFKKIVTVMSRWM